MKIIFENELIRVESTGRDYDFIATVENKTDKNIRLRYNPMDFDVIYDTIDIEPNDWVGLLADKEGYDLVRKFELGQVDVEVLEKEREDKRETTDIDITSLLDILVILLFFMLKSYNASDLTVDVVENLSLPNSNATQLGHNAIIVQVNKNGTIFVDNTELKGANFDGDKIAILHQHLKSKIDNESKVLESNRAPSSTTPRPINILLDQNHPSELMQKVMHTVALAGHDQIKLIVTGQN